MKMIASQWLWTFTLGIAPESIVLMQTAAVEVCNAPEFIATRGYPLGAGGFSMVAGDFNRDGKADVAVALAASTNTVQVFLGSGGGTLGEPIQYTPTLSPRFIKAADVNGDGVDDLLVNGVEQIWIMLGNGNGTFQNARAVPGVSGVDFAAGRFNSDTNLDLVLARSIYLNVRNSNVDGTFQADALAVVNEQESPVSVAVGDMNNDGKDDIVTGTSGTAHGSIGVLLGRGEGVFVPAPITPASTNNSVLRLGDFNQDGTTDVAASSYAGQIAIYLGRGDGSLRSNTVYSVGAELNAMAVADFDSDGTNDIAAASGKAVSILMGRAGGEFVPGLLTTVFGCLSQRQTSTVTVKWTSPRMLGREVKNWELPLGGETALSKSLRPIRCN